MSEVTEIKEKNEFSLIFATESIKIDGKKYTIKELSGEDRDKFLNAMAPKMQMQPDGKTAKILNFEGLQALLICKSLVDDQTNKQVDLKFVQSWPSKVQDAIFKKCQKLSGLEQEAEKVAEKNSQEKTSTGSPSGFDFENPTFNDSSGA